MKKDSAIYCLLREFGPILSQAKLAVQGAEAVNLSLSHRWALAPEQVPILMELERNTSISKEVELTGTELHRPAKRKVPVISSNIA